jgi:diguanylate cyclase (GGDEF)-like protein
LIVPLVFFLGSVFVLLVSTLSLETALDVRRIYLLEHENITDPLTGAYNRRYLDRRLNEEVLRTRRYGFPLAVLLIDIDHFKRINDEHGHPAGDLVLVALSRLVMDSVRKTDLVARYGGDELMVIAPHATPADAAELGERLRKKVEAQEIALENSGPVRLPLRVTISVGVADFRERTADSQGLIQAADQALYAAKQGGRNQVVLREGGSGAV